MLLQLNTTFFLSSNLLARFIHNRLLLFPMYLTFFCHLFGLSFPNHTSKSQRPLFSYPLHPTSCNIYTIQLYQSVPQGKDETSGRWGEDITSGEFALIMDFAVHADNSEPRVKPTTNISRPPFTASARNRHLSPTPPSDTLDCRLAVSHAALGYQRRRPRCRWDRYRSNHAQRYNPQSKLRLPQRHCHRHLQQGEVIGCVDQASASAPGPEMRAV